MTYAPPEPRPLPHWLGYAFVFGGMLGFALLVDLVRYFLGVKSPLSIGWVVLIAFCGMAIGVAAGMIFRKSRSLQKPTPNNRWRGP